MPDSLLDQLTAFASAIRIAEVAPPTVTSVSVQLSLPSNSDGQPLSGLAESVDQVVPTDMAVDLGFLAKSVRFQTPTLPLPNAPLGAPDASVTGGMPVRDQLVVDLSNANLGGLSSLIGHLTGNITDSGAAGTAPLPDVPGLVGRLKGSFQLPMHQVQTVMHPLAVDVQWRILDNGVLVASTSWTIAGAMPPVSGTGGAISLDPSNALRTLVLTFPPAFVELTNAPSFTVLRQIAARVRVSTTDVGLSSAWIDLPPLDVVFPAIPVPSCLVLFEHTGFTGRLLVAVPADSPLTAPGEGATGLSTALATLNTALTALGTGFPIAPFPSDLATLTAGGALGSEAPNFRFVKGDGFPQLEDIVWTDFIGIRIFSAEDSMSSLILVGPPGRQAQCFNGRAYDVSEGQFNVTTGIELVVDATDLGSAAPASTPFGDLSVIAPPSGMRPVLHRIHTFAGELSSVRFSWA